MLNTVIHYGGDTTGWEFLSGKPIHIQLISKITQMIITGAYAPGSKLPSVRDFAFEAAVNPNTMQRALSALENSGLILTERTSGRFVTADEGLIENARHELADENVIDYFAKMGEIGYNREDAVKAASEYKEVN